ncbi:hypothetical protein MATL_G00215960 [Megalops atlanticus]|uniref:Fibronectin type-III domain-containing protein n=1 Tax=Megalops atlanticus TaxID=7932 RepID=A0A9D3PGN1_MEGAT|nr:hypothetical protein MATL_G00215960 [Megalops atlanticus]
MLSIILVFFIDFGSVMSEAHLNVSSVNCFNDYKTSMICGFTSDEPLNCSGYSLDILSQQQEHFTCVFVNNSKRDSNHLFKCGCTVEMPEFVFVEEYTASLLEGRKIINSGKINASLSIKPQAPEILSVMQTGDGNFNVTWKTNYSENSIFGKSLKTQLSYKKKGEADEVASGYNCTGTFCIIPGSELEPSSEYVIKARSYSTKYGTEFSDWSNEVEWITSESTERMLKIIIPIFFVLLVINICALYWCCTKLKAKWWDRIPNPSNDIKKILPGNPKVFIPKQYDPSSYHIDFPTISAAEEKSCVTPLIEESGQDDPYKPVTSCVSTKDSADKVDKEAPSEGQEEFSGDQWETPQCPKWGIPDSISYASQFMQKLNQESPSH